MSTNRRRFIQTTAAAAAAPFILPSHIWGASTQPNDQLTMGFIGMGKQNRGLLNNFLNRDTRVVAVCDVDSTRRDAAKKTVDDHYAQKGNASRDCTAYTDVRKLIARKDLDAVCIATPDHWHAIATLAALRTGRDVYCEKPLTHNIHEAVTVIRTVDKYDRVLQTGSMQRSSKEFRIASELARNGAAGRIERVECSFGDPGKPCDLPEEEMEPGLDWDMWVGPAPMRAYNSTLSPRGNHNHFPHWRNYREFGGGMVTDWGAHHLDIAQWGLGMDDSGPVEVRPPANRGDKRGAVLVYANGVTVTHANGFGVHFYGTEGEIKVNRGRFEFIRDGKTVSKFTKKEDGGSLGSALAIAEREFLSDAKIKLYNSRNHIEDFMACTQSRKKPITSEQVGGRTAICCHLMNQSYYHHARIQWDPATFAFTNGTGDPSWLTRDYRAPWKV